NSTVSQKAVLSEGSPSERKRPKVSPEKIRERGDGILTVVVHVRVLDTLVSALRWKHPLGQTSHP
ncbi:MAG: hypothetical protein QXX87_03080, partial [Candidatus Jordarchaeales archaeon]